MWSEGGGLLKKCVKKLPFQWQVLQFNLSVLSLQTKISLLCDILENVFILCNNEKKHSAVASGY